MQPKRAFLNRWLAMTLALCLCVGMVSCAKSPFVEQNPQVNEVVNPNQENPYYQTGNDLTINLPGLMNADDRLIKDEEGNFTVPFDLAYPEAFAAGAFEYDSTVLLLKMPKDFDGKLTEELSACGFVSLEEFCVVTEAVWYRAKLSENVVITEAAAAARKLDGILMVDYDYIAEKASDDTPLQTNPMAVDQWYLDSCHIQEAWAHLAEEGINPGGSSSIIVAVIDTGVDYTHPDLASSMWVNPNEIPGNGIDDDGNGYVDDIHGCSTIGSSYDHNGDPMDDHGHGTHVAGIIGAANNNVGTVGIAYNTKIMAVKAGQATGVFNQSDIAEAILYAYENGAEVINMSFGGTACSLAVQEALQIAWTRAVLVASAGNEGRPNWDTFYYSALPNYPANLFYVIGVMSVNQSGLESSFSNWDANINGYNLYAPGENMLSTLPNGEYGYLSGTSMASPVVAGIAALLRSKFTDRDMYPAKFITGQLCSTSENYATCVDPEHHKLKLPDGSIGPTHSPSQIVDVYSALAKMPKPDLYLGDYYLFDDPALSEANNGDGVIDAGETVDIGVILYNRWGMSKDTIVTIDAIGDHGIANPYVEIITGSSNFEGVGTYSFKEQLIRDENGFIIGVDEPLRIKVREDCPNNYCIVINVIISCKNALDEADSTEYVSKDAIEFWVRNGVLLPAYFSEDTVLTADKLYVLSHSSYIPEGVTVTLSEGVQIQFYSDDSKDIYNDPQFPSIRVAGTLLAEGTPDNMVKMFVPEIPIARYPYNRSYFAVEIYRENQGVINLQYTEVMNPFIDVNAVENCVFYTFHSEKMGHHVFYNKIYSADSWTISEEGSHVLADYVVKTSAREIYDIRVLSTISCCSFEDVICVFSQIIKKTSAIECGVVSATIVDTCILWGGVHSEAIGNSVISSTSLTIPSPTGYYPLFVTDSDEMELLVLFRQPCNVEEFAKLIDCEVIEYSEVESTSIKETIEQNHWFKDFYVVLKGNYQNYDIQKVVSEYFGGYSGGNSAILINPNNPSGNASINASDRYEDAPTQICVSDFYWSYYDEELIEKIFKDFNDISTVHDLEIGEILADPPSETFPFVVDAYLLNQNGERVRVVNNETVTFVVEFNRDMDTSVPLSVTFGSSAETFYADYDISQHGTWVTPRRWEATYTLRTVIENGNHTIKIENGRAADDEWLKLYDVPGRFMFEIDTTAAQALIMQGHATETGIQLNWTQDDFDTLMGYNVYRSDSEDGYYQRLNSAVIPHDQKFFFDDTVEPGKVYYYNFTVVKTDLTESEPSGKISLMSMDTMAPNIYHSPVYTAFTGNNLLISATVTDNLVLKKVELYYRTAGTTEWKVTTMSANNSKYSGLIPAEILTTAGLEYYIVAYDGVSYTYKGTAENPYFIAIQQAVDKSAMGDVNGDGVITNLDALMLLQAINDLLNLDAEQFARADLNGDGVLTAAEALRILQYVSGAVGDVNMP